MRVSEAQRRALAALTDGQTYSPYRAKIRMDTLDALRRKGLVEERTALKPGVMWSPRTNRTFRITPAGRKALESSDVE
jgi:hypothetical protein